MDHEGICKIDELNHPYHADKYANVTFKNENKEFLKKENSNN